MKTNIQGSFDQVRKALDIREQLLIRQLQVLERQAHPLTKEIDFIPENEVGLLHLIRVFGRFNLHKLNVSSDFLSSEDYICPQDDHVLINKQLIQQETTAPDQVAAIHLAMVDDNANNINESLINLILNESKELVSKSKVNQKRSVPMNNNNNNNINKEGRHGNKKLQIGDTPVPRSAMENKIQQSSALTAAVTEKPPKHAMPTSASIPKNFSSLKAIPNLSGTLNLRRPTAIVSSTDYDVQAVTCDFYHRLINENKLLQPHNRRSTINTAVPKPKLDVSPSPSSTNTSSTSFKDFCTEFERKVVDNWEECDGLPVDPNGNVTAVINCGGNNPKQIQLWLKQIIHEPELEPMQNEAELMEFSRIKSP